MYHVRMQEQASGVNSSAPVDAVPSYSPTRRTAVVLVGEGTSVAYLAGALKALVESGVRIDLMIGKGVGALVAAFGAIQAGEKLNGRSGLLNGITRERPWRWRAPFVAGFACLAAAFGVFVSPAILGILLLVLLPLLAAVRIVAPGAVDAFYQAIQGQVATFAAQLDPFYLRAMSFPIAVLFAILVVRWVIPGLIGGRRGGVRGWRQWFGEGLVDLAPSIKILERGLWEAVRGASVETRPPRSKDIGLRYRDLLLASLGQHGFCELMFYALDLSSGQEVPFVLLKERWLTRMTTHGPGRSAVAAEPMDLTGEAGVLFFDALVASVSPPIVTPSVKLKLPLEGRYGGEVHSFASSLLAGQSAVVDAVAAGAQQIIYVSGSTAGEDSGRGLLQCLTDAAVRQSLEADLRWGRRDPSRPAMFVVRPEKPRLGLYEFSGRRLSREERLEVPALAAHGERDMSRMFIHPIVGQTGRSKQTSSPEGDRTLPLEKQAWSEGPKQL